LFRAAGPEERLRQAVAAPRELDGGITAPTDRPNAVAAVRRRRTAAAGPRGERADLRQAAPASDANGGSVKAAGLRASAAAVCIGIAVVLVLLALDARAWSSRFRADDLRYRHDPSAHKLWTPREL